MSILRLANIIPFTTVDGHGLRMSIYFQGCSHACPGCHNPGTHDPKGGYEVSLSDIIRQVQDAKYIRGITLSGGDPLFQKEGVTALCKAIKEVRPDLDIVLYTGYTFEEVKLLFPDVLSFIDFMVDGKFQETNKSFDLYFYGSTNQKYIDVQRSLSASVVVERTRFSSIQSFVNNNVNYRRGK